MAKSVVKLIKIKENTIKMKINNQRKAYKEYKNSVGKTW